ncbi:MAG: HEAT repeat domain-containing protein [Candidatus Nitrosocaldus sp.]|nr:HEAT repeat domain-containing protein [Candidatus Nitrosocaldus sp.]MDW8000769.1 HEAT repeat domain-containing protein [Candidatus Nitrosocaldus sp.]
MAEAKNLLLEEMEEAFYRKDAEYFKSLLKHDDFAIRTRAVCILAEIGGEDAVKPICDVLLNDPNALVRHEAAFSLGQMGYASAVDSLIHAMLNDDSQFVRHEAAIALGVIGSEDARWALTMALRDDSREVRESAEIALANLDYLAYSRERGSSASSRFARLTGG